MRMWVRTVMNIMELDKVCDAEGRKLIEFGNKYCEI
jgi:hypothetical protein